MPSKKSEKRCKSCQTRKSKWVTPKGKAERIEKKVDNYAEESTSSTSAAEVEPPSLNDGSTFQKICDSVYNDGGDIGLQAKHLNICKSIIVLNHFNINPSSSDGDATTPGTSSQVMTAIQSSISEIIKQWEQNNQTSSAPAPAVDSVAAPPPEKLKKSKKDLCLSCYKKKFG